MRKYSSKDIKKRKPFSSPIPRSWGLAARLEHRRIKGKNRKRPGKEK